MLASLLVLFLASIAIFLVVSMAGDPLLDLKQNPRVDADDIARFTALYGLDKPLWQQYLIWLGDFVRGDLGTSFAQRVSVNELVSQRIGPTVLLMGTALIIIVLVAIPFGVYSAIKRGSALDNTGTIFSFIGYATPVFALGLILQLLFGVYLTQWAGTRIFYTSGMTDTGGFVDLLQHLALPAVALSVLQIAALSRLQRSEMLDVLSSDYLRTARAKGLSQRTVYLKHALRNALMLPITVIALEMGAILGGAIITETVFAWPGLGFAFSDALYKGDYNVARALLMITAVMTVFFNLVADLAYSFVDPRVRLD